ncbi:MAG: glutamine-hydrolyzing carbamoyl-phosphate synthase small subunit [Leptospiraceae bacterium]|nr:glutamine-hydrolyzing carbamoyl-phosphate synthase small subunit [Leptospiraceae bacterium]MDW8307009.1 glutamine-hydrolyzing carbamoyl-phosphate synthase small subunit [Leptospiraceae bacterium]
MKKRPRGVLLLADGRFFKGDLIGYLEETGRLGEVIFNTSMSGYQEVITDPSYYRQFVCFTYPSIGNYGVNDEDNESHKPWLEGIIIRHYHERPSNHRAKYTLEDFLLKHRLPALCEVDTRALVRHIREKGAQQAGLFYLSEDPYEDDKLLEMYLKKVQEAPPMEGSDLTQGFDGHMANEFVKARLAQLGKDPSQMYRVAVLDFGIKYSILENLLQHDIYPTVFAGSKPILENPHFQIKNFDGFFFSNGPGDPAAVSTGIENIRLLAQTGKPCFGICLGHQLLALALGGKTYKMKFGHHGANQPVKATHRARVIITSQNHGFAVDEASTDFLLQTQARETNPNDNTSEGFLIFNKDKKILSVQYHPEAAPGPHDGRVVFAEFAHMLRESRV